MAHPGCLTPSEQARFVLLSVGRLTRRKGLAEFVANALPAILASCPEAQRVIIGEAASDALHTQAGSERDRIAAAASEAGIESSVRLRSARRCSVISSIEMRVRIF